MQKTVAEAMDATGRRTAAKILPKLLCLTPYRDTETATKTAKPAKNYSQSAPYNFYIRLKQLACSKIETENTIYSASVRCCFLNFRRNERSRLKTPSTTGTFSPDRLRMASASGRVVSS